MKETRVLEISLHKLAARGELDYVYCVCMVACRQRMITENFYLTDNIHRHINVYTFYRIAIDLSAS